MHGFGCIIITALSVEDRRTHEAEPAVVAPVGTTMAPTPFLGGQMVPTFAVPPDGSGVGWWAEGPQVDAPGMAIMLGIKQVGGGYTAFNRLDDLHPGDQVTVTDATGSARADFRITRVVPDILKNDPEALRRVLADRASADKCSRRQQLSRSPRCFRVV